MNLLKMLKSDSRIFLKAAEVVEFHFCTLVYVSIIDPQFEDQSLKAVLLEQLFKSDLSTIFQKCEVLEFSSLRLIVSHQSFLKKSFLTPSPT